jgi:glycine betaine/proline transport system ATP-binding protein
VLTAESVMEPPTVTLGMDQGPRVAHKLMREHQLSRLFVVSKDKVLRGLVREDDVADAVRAGTNDLAGLIRTDVTTVAAGTAVADLFGLSAEAQGALPVLADGDRLIGVIPRVTLLNALSSSAPDDAAGILDGPVLIKSGPDREHPPGPAATLAPATELEV